MKVFTISMLGLLMSVSVWGADAPVNPVATQKTTGSEDCNTINNMNKTNGPKVEAAPKVNKDAAEAKPLEQQTTTTAPPLN